MSDKEKEYILWLCKRLVYRYKENPQITNIVSKILEKNQTELSVYKQTHDYIKDQIMTTIENLNSIKTYYCNSIDKNNNTFCEKTVRDINQTFENIDIQSLFR